MEDDKKNSSGDQTYYMPLGMCLGMSLGTAIGVATDNMTMYMVLGMALGMCFGLLIDARNRSKTSAGDETDEDNE